MACVSAGTWLRGGRPSASLSVRNGFCTTPTRSSVSVNYADSRTPDMLQCSLLSSSLSVFSRSSFLGLSMDVDLNFSHVPRKEAGNRLVVRAKRFQIVQTKRNRSRKSLARTHGFRLRMRTTGGRAALKRRRDKGRWVICPKSNPSSGKRA